MAVSDAASCQRIKAEPSTARRPVRPGDLPRRCAPSGDGGLLPIVSAVLFVVVSASDADARTIEFERFIPTELVVALIFAAVAGLVAFFRRSGSSGRKGKGRGSNGGGDEGRGG
jgi:uncharacterized membrane protein YgcG